MAKVNMIEKNGRNPFLDYDLFVDSINSGLPRTVRSIDLVVMNNFPVALSNSTNIDLLIFLKIPEKDGGYLKVNTLNDHFYVKNKIFAISILNLEKNSQLELEDQDIIINDALFDLTDANSEIKWNTVGYLAKSLEKSRKHLSVDSLHWIRGTSKGVNKNAIAAKNLVFSDLIKYLSIQPYGYRFGCLQWKKYEDNFLPDITRVIESASKDSETGYITKKKLERIQLKQNEAGSKAFKQIGKQLVTVKGKPGTGKSSDLMHWMLNRSVQGRDYIAKGGILLTYNHLLVNDLTYLIKAFRNRLDDDKLEGSKTISSNTIHSFMYRLTKRLGVQAIMSGKRLDELMQAHKTRLNHIISFISQTIKGHIDGLGSYSVARLKTDVQHSSLDKKIRIVGIEFIQYIEKDGIRHINSKNELMELREDYNEYILQSLLELVSKEVFLKDYHNLLKRTTELIDDPEQFYNAHGIDSLFDLLKGPMRLREEKILGDDGKIDIERFNKRIQYGLRGFKKGRIVYLDEAQDCHGYERDLIYQVFGPSETVIADGGFEQLIRYNTSCDWNISKSLKISSYDYVKKRKSFRMKPAIAALANFIALKYELELNIEPQETEDTGRVIIRGSSNIKSQLDYLEQLHDLGITSGCTTYEAVLMLCPPSQDKEPDDQENQQVDPVKYSEVQIDEYDNIRLKANIVRPAWKLIAEGEKRFEEFRFWDATGNIDKRDLGTPGALSLRSIYYESSRGIEAWSVMCFGLDVFYEQKKNEKEAEFHNLEKIYFDPEARKREYAAKWVLMAITRPIDTIYIELKDQESELTKYLLEFAQLYPQYVTNKF